MSNVEIEKKVEKKEEVIPQPKELTLDDLYRLRAASGLNNIEYGKTGRKDAAFFIHKSGMSKSPLAFLGSEAITKYFVRINEIVDMAIKLSIENQKLHREVGRFKKTLGSPF